MSARRFRAMSVFTLIAIVQAACYLPSTSTSQPSPPADGTAAILTAVAAVAATLTQAAQGGLGLIQPSLLPEATITSTSLPTLTPTVTLTPTETPTPTVTLTPTPEGAFISVSTETKCRLGPGNTYDQVGGLVADKNVQVFGRDPSGQYYYIHNPNDPTSYCWVWAFYATPVGDIAAVPVFTPAATPTPSPAFTVAYIGLTTCAPWYAFRFTINNTGGVTWESIRIVVTDNTTATSKTHIRDTFLSYIGCVVEMEQSDMMPGESGNVANINPGHLDYDPSGHSITATFTLCTGNGLGGTCFSQTINFTP
jgi:hypothetical protein